jgi:hypothetical protein
VTFAGITVASTDVVFPRRVRQEPADLLREPPGADLIATENRIGEGCSKPCYNGCNHRSARVRIGRVIAATCASVWPMK